MPFDEFDIRGLVFFSIGGYLQLFIQKQRTKAIEISKLLCWFGIWLFLIIGFLNIFHRSILPITVLIGVTTIVIVSMKLAMKVKNDERLSKSSFFIFAFHMFIITLVETIYRMSHIDINNEVLLIVLYLLFPIIHCFLSYLAYLFVSKNKVLSLFLLGKRN
jgi:peptidoglycan/LPS O-acetylase OafA/YrhL